MVSFLSSRKTWPELQDRYINHFVSVMEDGVLEIEYS